MHDTTTSVQHHVVQQLILHRSSRQHLVLHMQVRPEQQKTLEAVQAPLSTLNRHTYTCPATRIPQPSATGVLTPERLLADEVKSFLQQLCLALCSLLSASPSLQLQTPSSSLHVVRHPVCPTCQQSAAPLLLPPADPCLCDVLVRRPYCSSIAAAVCCAEPHCQAAPVQHSPPPVPRGAPAPCRPLQPGLL